MILLPMLAITTQNASGEALLDQLFVRYEKLRNVEISVSKAGRIRKGEALEAATEMILRYADPKKFQLDVSEYWGGGSRYVSDGTTLLTETIDGPIVLKNAGTLIDADPGLALHNGNSCVIFAFLKGPSMKSKMVVPNAPIQSGKNWIQFQTKDFGVMTLTLSDGWINQISFDNKPGRMANYLLFPMFGDKPEDPMEIEAYSYRFGVKFAKSWFDARPPKGMAFQDQRKKGQGQPREGGIGYP